MQVPGAEVEDGGGDGPPVVLVRAAGHAPQVLAPQATLLGDVYRTIGWATPPTDTTDATGQRRPSGTPDGRAMGGWDAARVLFVLLDRMGIERAVLVGLEDATEVVLRAALLHPDRVRALVLLDASATGSASPAEAGATPAEALDELADRLDELAMPVLVVHGAEHPGAADASVLARAHQVRQAASDVRGVVEVVGSGGPRLPAHPATGLAVRDFLEGLPA